MTGRRHRKPTKDKEEWDGNVYGLELVGKGGTGFVFAIDKARVVKIPAGSDISFRAFRREREAFRILGREGQSQFLLTCLDYHLRDRLVLERCQSTVRERLQLQALECTTDSPRWYNAVFMKSSITWAYQAAEGLSFVHSKRIVHADVGCHNMLLDANDNVKISDFSGSGIYKKQKGYLSALVIYDNRSRKPGTSEATAETDIFALGSAIYELATGYLPYADRLESQVNILFEAKEWPEDLESIKAASPAMRNAIFDCWNGAYKDVDEVVYDLKPTSRHEHECLPQSTCSTATTFSGETLYYNDTGNLDDHMFSEKYSEPLAPPRKKRRPKKKRQSGSLISWLRSQLRSFSPGYSQSPCQ